METTTRPQTCSTPALHKTRRCACVTWTWTDRGAAADRLNTAEFLTASALQMLADPTMPIGWVLDNLDAATDAYAEFARGNGKELLCAWCGEPEDRTSPDGLGTLARDRDGDPAHVGCAWSEEHGAMATLLHSWDSSTTGRP